MTCADYGAKDFSDQTNVIMRMIQDHGLDPTSNVIAAAQIGVDVNSFCGLSGLAGSGSKPTKNQAASIEKAVDWDSYRKT